MPDHDDILEAIGHAEDTREDDPRYLRELLGRAADEIERHRLTLDAIANLFTSKVDADA